MSLTCRSLLRHSCCLKLQSQWSSSLNTLPKDVTDEKISSFRTLESDPINHNEQHLNRFYTIPKDVYKTFLQDTSIPKQFRNQIITFTECCILVRSPAVEVISYLEETDYSRPINKYVLYGKYGTGKTLSLLHILHYVVMKKMIVVHVPTPNIWFQDAKEIVNSDKMPGIIDLPIHAGQWLSYFKFQNNHLLSTLNLKISKDYEWSHREKSSSGTSLLEIIDFGINRIRYASSVIEAVLTELKEASIAGKCRVIAIIDGYNAFWSDVTAIRNDQKVIVNPRQISLTLAFHDFLKPNWCNGAAVLVVDKKACKERRESDNPMYLLGKDGFEYLDPFLPILVESYNKSEFDSVIEYYKERKWIREISPKGKTELWSLTNGHPSELMDLCRDL